MAASLNADIPIGDDGTTDTRTRTATASATAAAVVVDTGTDTPVTDTDASMADGTDSADDGQLDDLTTVKGRIIAGWSIMEVQKLPQSHYLDYVKEYLTLQINQNSDKPY